MPGLGEYCNLLISPFINKCASFYHFFSLLAIGSQKDDNDTDCAYEISNPLHKQKLRLSRALGDFHVKWTTLRETDEDYGALSEKCDSLRGSYSVPAIRADLLRSTNSASDDLKPVFLRLLDPTQQPVSCMPDVIVRPRDVAR